MIGRDEIYSINGDERARDAAPGARFSCSFLSAGAPAAWWKILRQSDWKLFGSYAATVSFEGLSQAIFYDLDVITFYAIWLFFRVISTVVQRSM